MTVFIEGYQADHRNTGQFQSNIEKNEAACADHEIHTQQGTQSKQVEFSGFVAGVLTGQPASGLHEYQQGTGCKDGFHYRSHGGAVVHTSEEFLIFRYQIQYQLYYHQCAGQCLQGFVMRCLQYQVGQQDNDEYDRQADFSLHRE